MKYAVEMGSGAAIYNYMPRFMKIGSGIQTLLWGGGNSQTHREHGDRISLVSFFNIRN
jgi:hypothetical protein